MASPEDTLAAVISSLAAAFQRQISGSPVYRRELKREKTVVAMLSCPQRLMPRRLGKQLKELSGK